MEDKNAAKSYARREDVMEIHKLKVGRIKFVLRLPLIIFSLLLAVACKPSNYTTINGVNVLEKKSSNNTKSANGEAILTNDDEQADTKTETRKNETPNSNDDMPETQETVESEKQADDKNEDMPADNPGNDTPVVADRPNIIFIMTDDQGYGDLWANLPAGLQAAPQAEGIRERTVNMSQLAENGVRFTNAYSGGPVCALTRAMTMSGKYQQSFGFIENADSRVGLPLNLETIGDALQAGGYNTAYFGKWHIGLSILYHPLQRGFNFFYGFQGNGAHDYLDLTTSEPFGSGGNLMRNYIEIDEGNENVYLTDRITDEAIGYIQESAAKPEPFFAYLAYNAVHWPAQVPPGSNVDPDGPVRDRYMEMLKSLDEGIGRIQAELVKLGIHENTLIVLKGDNGGAGRVEAWNGELRGAKQTFWEGGIRVPLIASWPSKITPGQQIDEMVMSFDVYPTLVEAAGLKMPDDGNGYHGKSFYGHMKQEGQAAAERSGPLHECLFWNRGSADGAVRCGNYKLVWEDGNNDGLLFDLSADVSESNPINDNQIRNDLENRYNAWLATFGTRLSANDGCRDPRFSGYTDDLVRHVMGQCGNVIEKTGCLDVNALNFDIMVTIHDPNSCTF